MNTIQMTPADVAYARANYFTRDELLVGRHETADELRAAMREGELPRPTYVLPDGTELFPADWLDLLDESGGGEQARSRFIARYVDAGGTADDAADDWETYADGVYGVCLVRATPENIVRKGRLVDSLGALLADPDPAADEWRVRLRRGVWELDALLREFSPDLDRSGRFPLPPSRDRFVGEARAQFADVLAQDATTSVMVPR
jgi:Family of unknown function (DUF6058)